MKKSKILMPLTGIAALGAITPIAVMASCHKGDDTKDDGIAKIEATTQKANTYVGITIKKEDIKVVVTYKDTTKAPEVITDWTCDEIGDDGYHFSKEETKEFTIKYKEHETKITFTAELAGAMMFDLLPVNLVVGDGFATEVAVHVYAVNVEQTNPHEVESQYLDIESEDETKVKYDATTHRLIAVGAGEIEITAKLKGVEEKAYTATKTVSVDNTADHISKVAADEKGTGAVVTVKAGDADTKICNIPEYVQIDGKDLPVKELYADNEEANGSRSLQDMEALVLPSTITKIDGQFANGGAADGHIFTVTFAGTSNEWANVNIGKFVHGYGLTGVWCLGGEEPKFVNFKATHDAQYIPKSEEVEKPYFSAKMSSILPGGSHTVGFDIVLAKSETEAEVAKYQIIDIINTGLAIGTLDIDGVYVNGEEWTKTTTAGTAKTYIVTGGRHNTKVTLDPTTKLTLNDRVVITFRSPGATVSSITVNLEKA